MTQHHQDRIDTDRCRLVKRQEIILHAGSEVYKSPSSTQTVVEDFVPLRYFVLFPPGDSKSSVDNPIASSPTYTKGRGERVVLANILLGGMFRELS
jgi:hypothetical protein